MAPPMKYKRPEGAPMSSLRICEYCSTVVKSNSMALHLRRCTNKTDRSKKKKTLGMKWNFDELYETTHNQAECVENMPGKHCDNEKDVPKGSEGKCSVIPKEDDNNDGNLVEDDWTIEEYSSDDDMDNVSMSIKNLTNQPVDVLVNTTRKSVSAKHTKTPSKSKSVKPAADKNLKRSATNKSDEQSSFKRPKKSYTPKSEGATPAKRKIKSPSSGEIIYPLDKYGNPIIMNQFGNPVPIQNKLMTITVRKEVDIIEASPTGSAVL